MISHFMGPLMSGLQGTKLLPGFQYSVSMSLCDGAKTCRPTVGCCDACEDEGLQEWV